MSNLSMSIMSDDNVNLSLEEAFQNPQSANGTY